MNCSHVWSLVFPNVRPREGEWRMKRERERDIRCMVEEGNPFGGKRTHKKLDINSREFLATYSYCVSILSNRKKNKRACVNTTEWESERERESKHTLFWSLFRDNGTTHSCLCSTIGFWFWLWKTCGKSVEIGSLFERSSGRRIRHRLFRLWDIGHQFLLLLFNVSDNCTNIQ
jgi:hypothetical protein